MNVSSELAFGISVVQSWALQQATANSLSDPAQEAQQPGKSMKVLEVEESKDVRIDTRTKLSCACGAGSTELSVHAPK
jgi:hypothetical protein